MAPCDGGRAAADLKAAPLAVLCCGTVAYFTGIGLLAPEVPVFVAGPLRQSATVVGLLSATYSVFAIAGRVPLVFRSRPPGLRRLAAAGALISAVGAGVVLAWPTLSAVVALRILGGIGDALFMTAASAAVAGTGADAAERRRLAQFSLAVNGGLLVGPVLGEALRQHAGYTAVWMTATLLPLAGLAAAAACPAKPPAAQPLVPGHGGSQSFRAVFRVTVLYAVVTIAPAVFSTFGALYAHAMGEANAAPVFVVLTASTVATRLLTATTAAPAVQAPTLLLIAACGLALPAVAHSPTGLICGAAAVGLSQGFAFPALVTEAVAASGGRRTAAVATVTVGFDVAFIATGAMFGPIAAATSYSTMFGAAAAVTAISALTARVTAPRRPANG